MEQIRSIVQGGNGIELEAIGLQFKPYLWRPCGLTWDSSRTLWRTVMVIKLLRTSTLFILSCDLSMSALRFSVFDAAILPVEAESYYKTHKETSLQLQARAAVISNNELQELILSAATQVTQALGNYGKGICIYQSKIQNQSKICIW